MNDAFIRFEVNRYLGWPGQAPSYKVGQRIWEQLRDEYARARAPPSTSRSSTGGRSTSAASASTPCGSSAARLRGASTRPVPLRAPRRARRSTPCTRGCGPTSPPVPVGASGRGAGAIRRLGTPRRWCGRCSQCRPLAGDRVPRLGACVPFTVENRPVPRAGRVAGSARRPRVRAPRRGAHHASTRSASAAGCSSTGSGAPVRSPRPASRRPSREGGAAARVDRASALRLGAAGCASRCRGVAPRGGAHRALRRSPGVRSVVSITVAAAGHR